MLTLYPRGCCWVGTTDGVGVGDRVYTMIPNVIGGDRAHNLVTDIGSNTV